MKYVIGAVVGLLWGALIAFLNSRISKRALQKENTQSIMIANLCRMLIDLAALTVVFLLRNVAPWSFEAAIVATACSLGMLTVVFAFLLARPEKPGTADPADSAEQNKQETDQQRNAEHDE